MSVTFRTYTQEGYERLVIFVTGGSGFVGRHLSRYLKRQGAAVRALVRSREAADLVQRAGAEPVSGDLHDLQSLTAGMTGCDIVFHVAANLQPWGRFADFYEVNVWGTEQVVRAAYAAGVARLVHVSTEAVLADGGALLHVDEAWPIPRMPLGAYARTKAQAEHIVRRANTQRCTTMIVRPRFVWGAGDTSQLPHFVDAAKRGRFAWIDGGYYLTSTCHVENLCEGLWCAAQHGRGGECYFVTDGAPVQVRSFGEALMRTQGIALTGRSVPRNLAMLMGTTLEFLWRSLGLAGIPPVTRAMVATMGNEITLDDSKARREIGYVGRMTIENGLRAMRQT